MPKLQTIIKARYLRREETKAEKILWQALRNKKLGVKFRRQHPVEKFILDFYAPEIKLCIELDGPQHAENREYDKLRTEYLKSLEIKMIRFWNSEVEQNIEKAVKKIKREINKNKLFAYYDKLISEHPDNNSQAQGWASNETQNARFEIFLKIANLNESTILDVGCGFGDFYDFLKKRSVHCQYKGIDINPEMIRIAKEKHPKTLFEIVDFWDNVFNKKFDYIFCSGALSFKIPQYKEFYFSQIKKMFELSKIGVAFNMLSQENNTKPGDEELYATYSIEETYNFCLELTSKIDVHQNYLPNDFSFFLYH